MKFESFCRLGMTEDERAEALTKAAVELTTAEAPKWEFIAARLLNHSFRCRNAQEWEGRGVGDLYGRLRYLTDKGLYGDYILAHYTHEEIAMAEDFLCPERDELFTYSGLDLLLKRYVIQSRSRVPLETPQEMFLGIALHLAMNEGSDRMGWVKRFTICSAVWRSRWRHLPCPTHESPTIAFKLLCGHCAGQSGRHLPLAGQLRKGL